MEIIAPLSNGTVLVLNESGNTKWRADLPNRPWSSPSTADIDNDGYPELVIATRETWNSSVYVFNHDGTNASGWPKNIEGRIFNSAVIGDIDQDGDFNIIACSDKNIYVFNSDGTYTDGWPVNITCFYGSPALGDIDNDGDIEIVINKFDSPRGTIVLHHNGVVADGWPVVTVDTYDNTPVIGDIDGDDDVEILVSTGESNDMFYAFHHDGTNVSGWPKKVPVLPYKERLDWHFTKFSSPVITDIDNDGLVDIVLGDEKYLFVWDMKAPYNPETMHWPMFQHDVRHTGVYTIPVDLEVLDFLKISPENPQPGENITFYYRIFNHGTKNMTNLFFRIDTDSAVPDIINSVPISVMKNSSYFGFVQWSYPSSETYQPTFNIDYNNNYIEVNEDNNDMSTSVSVISVGQESGKPKQNYKIGVR